jgi:cytochrome b561
MEIFELLFYLLEFLLNIGFGFASFGNPGPLFDSGEVRPFRDRLFELLFYINFVVLIIAGVLIYLYPSQYKNWNTYTLIIISTILIGIKTVKKLKK